MAHAGSIDPPGTIAAVAHCIHPIVCPMAPAARLTDRGLAAMPVRNMAEETTEVCGQKKKTRENGQEVGEGHQE